MKHKYLRACALAASLYVAQGASAQPQDAGQPRAGVPLTPEQAQEFQLKQQAERQKRLEEAQAAERRTPAGMLNQFATALNDGDLILASRSVEAETALTNLRRISSGLRQGRTWSFQLRPIVAEAPEGKNQFEARIAILPEISDPLDLRKDDPLLYMRAASIENVTLRRGANGEWKIVPRPIPATILAAIQFFALPPKTATSEAAENSIKVLQSDADGYLNTWVRALTQPRVLMASAISRVSMSNIKQVMLGVLQFSQDNAEKLDFTSANFQDKLQPYVKNQQIFLAPTLDEDEPFAYTLNPNIVGKSLADFAEPARTVAIYEADKDGKLLARFDGKVVIGFVDGHVKLTAPEDAEKLVWKP